MPTQTGNTPPPSPGLHGKHDEFAPQPDDDDQDENMDINRQTLELYHSTDASEKATQAAWKSFVDRHPSKEAAGEAIYQALYEAAPSLQSLFSSSKAVQAPKFMIALHELIMAMKSPEKLQTFVETLGFQHLHLETTSARVVIFRDAIIDVIAFELGDHFTEEAKNGLHSLINYAGGGIIYVRTHYADRLRILQESWKICKDKAKSGSIAEKSTTEGESSEESSEDGNPQMKSVQFNNAKQQQGTIGKMKSFFSGNSKDTEHNGHGEHEHENGHAKKRHNNNSNGRNMAMPTSFEEMFAVNSAVMGIAVGSWMTEVLESFDSLVSNVANSTRMKEEADVLALKLSKHDDPGNLDLDTFKACMLAALRSLLPKSWTSAHEVAWTWMWENVARLLRQVLMELPKYQVAMEKFLETMQEAELFDMRKAFYERLFEMEPKTQFYFKQSNTRLQFISERIMRMTVELYQEPKQMLADIAAVGLRHVEFGIPTDLFAAFVSSSVEVMCTVSKDSYALDAYRWSLGLISRILVRTIDEGSTLVMQAINANSKKSLMKSIELAPRAERAAWLLDIQVGTQSISPLSWAIESGALDVAKTILKDLLTIRSDRDTYYFGAQLLFRRHPDIVRRLVEDADRLLPTLLDGLVWRSHRHEAGKRRVNYYVKYLLINPAGEFADALKWLAATGDPATIAHPVVGVLSDSLWAGVVYRQFVVNKMWNVLSLLVFMLSQGILPRSISPDTDQGTRDRINYAIAAGRVFSYTLNMSRLACFHLARIWSWVRGTMKRIFDEIDQDGSGSIDWEEFKEAIGLFKQSLKDQFFEVFKFLKDDEGPAMMEDDKKVRANQSKNMYNIISFLLMVLLATMLSHEPMLWCLGNYSYPTGQCIEMETVKYKYSIFSCSALVIHWLILVDLAVFSTEISAFLLVCSHVMGEVKTFLTALTFLLITFGSSIPIFCTGTNCPLVAGNYSSMPRAVVSLFAITLGWFEADDVMDVRSEDRMFLAVLMIFVGLSVILLLNLLIAQLNRSYEYIYQDMLGFARLNRASLIVEAMGGCTRSKWRKFFDGMHFEQKIEFDAGDIGIAGGMQATELRGEHSVLEDPIQRFGGSTSPEQPWPTHMSADTEDTDDRFDRLEQLLMKAVKRCSAAKRSGGQRRGSGTGSGTGGGTGTQGSSGFSDDTGDFGTRQFS